MRSSRTRDFILETLNDDILSLAPYGVHHVERRIYKVPCGNLTKRLPLDINFYMYQYQSQTLVSNETLAF